MARTAPLCSGVLDFSRIAVTMRPMLRDVRCRSQEKRPRRRARRCIGSLALLAMGVVACSSDPNDGRGLLRRTAADAPTVVWSFVDRPAADQLLECVAGLEAVAVAVDLRDVPRMEIRREDGSPVALWFDDASFVQGSLVGANATEWVRADRRDSETVAKLEAALGTSLSSWVFSDQLPPSPRRVVDSSLQLADRVEVLSSFAPSVSTVQVIIGQDRVAELDGTQPTDYPTLTLTIDDNALTSVAARPPGEEESFGFRWEYEAAVPSVPDAPSDWDDAATITIRATGNRDRQCAIGP